MAKISAHDIFKDVKNSVFDLFTKGELEVPIVAGQYDVPTTDDMLKAFWQDEDEITVEYNGQRKTVPCNINSHDEDRIARAIMSGFAQIYLSKTNESMNKNNNKKQVRLTESQLHKIIKESADRIVNEVSWPVYANAAKAAKQWREDHPYKYDRNRQYDFEDMAAKRFKEKHGIEEPDDYSKHGYSRSGQINVRMYDGIPEISASRDHDFGDEDRHGLGHTVYHMGKKYGENGNYGRTRMWDFAHETTPEDFFENPEMARKFRDAEADAEAYNKQFESKIDKAVRESVKKAISEAGSSFGKSTIKEKKVIKESISPFKKDEIREIEKILKENPIEDSWKPVHMDGFNVQRVDAGQTPGRAYLLDKNEDGTDNLLYVDVNGIIFIQIGREPNTPWYEESGRTYMCWK